MSNEEIQICAFHSNECNGKIHEVGDKVSIPKTNINLISCGMLLCMFHYNKFILNENHRLKKMLQVCSHPKHEIYLSQSNKSSKQKQNPSLINIPKRFINILGLEESAKICSRYKKILIKIQNTCKLKNTKHQFQLNKIISSKIT